MRTQAGPRGCLETPASQLSEAQRPRRSLGVHASCGPRPFCPDPTCWKDSQWLVGTRCAHSAEQTQSEWGRFPTQLAARDDLLQPSWTLRGRRTAGNESRREGSYGEAWAHIHCSTRPRGYPLMASVGNHQTQGEGLVSSTSNGACVPSCHSLPSPDG